MTPVILNGDGGPVLDSFPFENSNNTRGAGGRPFPNGVHWPPTPSETPRTPEKGFLDKQRISASPSPSRRSLSVSEDPDTGSLANSQHMRAETMPVPAPFRARSGSEGAHGRTHAKVRTYADDQRAKQYPRISRPVELMRISYDCVVIGSGYGGGVAASRMARAGQSVCLLELGSERWPGEYPAGTREAFSELHCSGELTPNGLRGLAVNNGKPTGMYHLIFGKGVNAVVCNGRFSRLYSALPWSLASL